MRAALRLAVCAFVPGAAMAADMPVAATSPPECAHAAAELARLAFPITGPDTLQAAKPADFVFGNLAHCLQRTTDGAPQAAVLIRLAPSADAVALRLSSVSAKDATLPAHVELLDTEFAMLKQYPFERFVKRGMDYTLTVFLGASPQPRYLLVTPDADWLGRSNNLTAGNRWTAFWTTGTVMGTISNGTEQHRQLPFAGAGTLHVEVEQDTRTVGATGR
jgi:hypothetical protein